MAVGTRPSKGRGVETGSDFLRTSGQEGWGRSLQWNLGAFAGEGRGAELDPAPPPEAFNGEGGCAYLVAPTLGVHKHQQGLHEGRRGGPDDEGSPAALLGDRETVRLYPGWTDLTLVLGRVPSRSASRADLKVGLATERQLGSGLPPSSGAQGAQHFKKQAPPSCSPPAAHPAPGLTSGPFLLDFLLKDALFFFLLALRVFCKGSRGIGNKAGGLGRLAEPTRGGAVTGAGSTHLWPAGAEDPGGRDDHSSVHAQGARLLYLLQHEAGHLAVVLEGRGAQLSSA